MPADEETRAVEFRRQQTARAQWEANQHLRAFPSSTPAMLAFRAKWLPVIDRQRDWDPPDEGLEDAGRGLQVP